MSDNVTRNLLNSRSDVFEMSDLFGFLNTDGECNTFDDRDVPVPCSGSFPTFSGHVQLSCCEPRRENNSLSIDLVVISSPLEALDTVRNNERFDFKTNGILMELDEFDLYQARLRAAPLPNPIHKMPPTDSQTGTGNMENKKSRRKMKSAKNTVCVFCKNNGETLSVYGTHVLKDASGRVTCPILRRYTCPICGAVGDNAHTIKYCPNNSNPISCLALLRTPRSSNGKNRCS